MAKHNVWEEPQGIDHHDPEKSRLARMLDPRKNMAFETVKGEITVELKHKEGKS